MAGEIDQLAELNITHVVGHDSAGFAGRKTVADILEPAFDAVGAVQAQVAVFASTASSAAADTTFNVFSQVTSNPPLTASTIMASGWELVNGTPVDVSLGVIWAVRKGFDMTGTPRLWVDKILRTKRVRQPYPNQASFTTNEEAFSEGLYNSDFVIGLANLSSRNSVKPVAGWAMPARLQVQNTIHWEIAAFHVDGRPWGTGGVGQQVACVRVRATNGVNATAWQTVSGTSISTYVEDANPLEVFQGDLDVSALPDASYWLEGEVYPWIGSASAILSSVDQSGAREFSRRYFTKRATINYIYVASTGNDATGVCSSTAATAAATPCLTIGGALLRARLALGTAAVGSLDGLRIRVVDAVNTGAASIAAFAPLRQDVAGVVIERAPGTDRASAVVTLSSGFNPWFSDTSGALGAEGSLIFYDVSVVAGGAFTVSGSSARKLDVTFWNCNLNFGSFATSLRGNSHMRFFGVMMSNLHTTSLGAMTGNEVRILRGVTANLLNAGYEQFLTLGCNLSQASGPAFTDAKVNGHIWYNNKFLNPVATNSVLSFAGAVAGNSGLDLGSFAQIQNLVEVTSVSAGASMHIAGDSGKGNIVNGVVLHNTLTGVEATGRVNISYDEDPAVARFHKNLCFKGNLVPQINVKGDDFGPISNGARTGHFEFEHGVRCASNFTRDVNASGGDVSFGQAYPGVGSIIAGGDPLFVNNQGVTKPAGTLVAGSGGGTYTLQAGSPARNLLPLPLLKYDLAGNARGTGAQHAGAYQ